MPSVSPAQAHLMAGIAHGWRPSGMANPPPVAVATEFNDADRGSPMLAAPRNPQMAKQLAQAQALRRSPR